MAEDIGKIVVKVISDHIGSDPEDINMDDDLQEDLGLNAAGLAEIVEAFDEKGLAAEKINIDEIETVSDLIENLKVEEEL